MGTFHCAHRYFLLQLSVKENDFVISFLRGLTFMSCSDMEDLSILVSVPRLLLSFAFLKPSTSSSLFVLKTFALLLE